MKLLLFQVYLTDRLFFPLFRLFAVIHQTEQNVLILQARPSLIVKKNYPNVTNYTFVWYVLFLYFIFLILSFHIFLYNIMVSIVVVSKCFVKKKWHGTIRHNIVWGIETTCIAKSSLKMTNKIYHSSLKRHSLRHTQVSFNFNSTFLNSKCLRWFWRLFPPKVLKK